MNPGMNKEQVVAYLKILNFPLGLLIKFNEVLIKHGTQRVLNLNYRTVQSLFVSSRLCC